MFLFKRKNAGYLLMLFSILVYCYERGTQRHGGGTPYNGLYWEAPPERGTFFRLQVYKRVGISQAEVYKRVGISQAEVYKRVGKSVI